VLEYGEAGAGDPLRLERAKERRLVDDRTTSGVDEERRLS
jgi:hypothetical protein